MKNILFTGCCGFIGSNVINYFCKKYTEFNIYNIDRLDYCSSIKNVNNYKNYKFIKGDIKSLDLVNFILKSYKIDIVIHFAAQSHVDNSFGNSIVFTEDNVLGTHCLLECCKNYGNIKKFIHISTDEVYGEVEENQISSEKSLLNPTNPYAASKAAAEFLVKAYYTSFNLPIIITRGNNVFGPRQYPEKIIPKFISQILYNEKMTIHGIGNSVRNYIYVDDVSSAIDIILNKGQINEVYNIGTENEYSVMDIAKILFNIMRPNEKLEDNLVYVEDRNFNDKRYCVNSNKLKNLGWKEKSNFYDSIRKTIEWYKNLEKDYWKNT